MSSSKLSEKSSKKKKFLKSNLYPSFLVPLLKKKIFNLLIKKGKKSRIEKILKKIFVQFSLKTLHSGKVLAFAFLNTKPILEVRKVRKKRKVFQSPFPVKSSRQIGLAFRVILQSLRSLGTFKKSFLPELFSSALGKSQSVKTAINLHKLVLEHRMSTRYRWF